MFENSFGALWMRVVILVKGALACHVSQLAVQPAVRIATAAPGFSPTWKRSGKAFVGNLAGPLF